MTDIEANGLDNAHGFSIFLFKCTINYNLTKTNAVARTIIFASASALAIIIATVYRKC